MHKIGKCLAIYVLTKPDSLRRYRQPPLSVAVRPESMTGDKHDGKPPFCPHQHHPALLACHQFRPGRHMGRPTSARTCTSASSSRGSRRPTNLGSQAETSPPPINFNIKNNNNDLLLFFYFLCVSSIAFFLYFLCH